VRAPLAHRLGFVALPASFLAALAVMIILYLVLVELGKLRFYRVRPHGPPIARPRPEHENWIRHRATRWSIPGRPRRNIPADEQP
jgi:Mg2+-importing ATPase